MSTGSKPARSAGAASSPPGGHATLDAATIDLPSRPPRTSDAAAPVPPAGGDPYVGTTIDGRYLVERLIGEGGMGVVYAGRHRVIEKRVAIKVLRRDMATNRELNERFLQEARAASAIGNPHIVDVSDFGRLPDGSTYFVMELLEGKSLSEAIGEAGGPLPIARLLRVAKQIAQGLAAAHAANIVHRDLKPDNVMLVRRGAEVDFVKILDFGIAKVGGATTTKKMTRAGSVFGTPHYMSPEQAEGTAVDHRTDVYALGVILYEMASGRVPFDADNFMGILTQHMYKAPVPIRTLAPEVGVPPGLDAVVLRCLAKTPDGRYANMDELLADLEKVEHEVLPAAAREAMPPGGFDAGTVRVAASGPIRPPAPVSASRRRWPLYALVAAGGTLLGVAGVSIAVKGKIGKTRTSPIAQGAPVAGAPARSAAPAGFSSAAAPPVPSSRPPAPQGTAAAASARSGSEDASREILVSVVPSDATIVRDGNSLGQSPVAIHLDPGESAVLVVERKGFKTREVTVTSDLPKRTFTLEAIGGSATARPKRLDSRRAAPPEPAGIDDVGDPFAAQH